MPKTKTKKVATYQKETRKKYSSSYTGGKGRGTCCDSQTSRQTQPPPVSSHKRSRDNNAMKQQSDATPVTSNQSPVPRKRQKNGDRQHQWPIHELLDNRCSSAKAKTLRAELQLYQKGHPTCCQHFRQGPTSSTGYSGGNWQKIYRWIRQRQLWDHFSRRRIIR